VKELMKLVTAEARPFMVEVKELLVVDIIFELIIVVVPIEPAKLEVKVLAVEVKVLAAFKLVIVALVAFKLPVLVVEAFTVFADTELKIGLLVNE
jgi:hypothetical protein